MLLLAPLLSEILIETLISITLLPNIWIFQRFEIEAWFCFFINKFSFFVFTKFLFLWMHLLGIQVSQFRLKYWSHNREQIIIKGVAWFDLCFRFSRYGWDERWKKAKRVEYSAISIDFKLKMCVESQIEFCENTTKKHLMLHFQLFLQTKFRLAVGLDNSD